MLLSHVLTGTNPCINKAFHVVLMHGIGTLLYMSWPWNWNINENVKLPVDSESATKYSKTCVEWPLSKRPKMVFKTNYHLMQVKSIAQYFRPALRYQLILRSLFRLFLSGHFTQVFTV